MNKDSLINRVSDSQTNHHWQFAFLGALLLSLLSAGTCCDFGCDSDGDGDYDCDSDGDGNCDYGYDHNDDARDEMFEKAARTAAYLQWEPSTSSKRSHRARKLAMLPNSEIKKIRRKAFIWNHKKIKVGYCEDDLIGRSYETVYILLYNKGFKYIDCIPVKKYWSNIL